METPATPLVQTGCKPLTTFVHTDINSFREVVQRLTGPTEPNNKDQSTPPNSINKIISLQKPKLQERRQQGMRPKLEIVKPNSFRLNDQISPFTTSPIGTPSTILSSLTLKDECVKKSDSVLNSQEEEKAIKERMFYWHPSPRDREGYTEPELLTLFPLESPSTK